MRRRGAEEEKRSRGAEQCSCQRARAPLASAHRTSRESHRVPQRARVGRVGMLLQARRRDERRARGGGIRSSERSAAAASSQRRSRASGLDAGVSPLVHSTTSDGRASGGCSALLGFCGTGSCTGRPSRATRTLTHCSLSQLRARIINRDDGCCVHGCGCKRKGGRGRAWGKIRKTKVAWAEQRGAGAGRGLLSRFCRSSTTAALSVATSSPTPQRRRACDPSMSGSGQRKLQASDHSPLNLTQCRFAGSFEENTISV